METYVMTNEEALSEIFACFILLYTWMVLKAIFEHVKFLNFWCVFFFKVFCLFFT